MYVRGDKKTLVDQFEYFNKYSSHEKFSSQDDGEWEAKSRVE